MSTPSDILQVRVPVLFCRQCRTQVCVTDAIGRPTTPTFRAHGGSDLLCLFCAKQHPAPDQLQPINDWSAGWLPGSAPAMTDADLFDFLVVAGAEVSW